MIQVLGVNLISGALFGAGPVSRAGRLSTSGTYAAAGGVVPVLFAVVLGLFVVLNGHRPRRCGRPGPWRARFPCRRRP